MTPVRFTRLPVELRGREAKSFSDNITPFRRFNTMRPISFMLAILFTFIFFSTALALEPNTLSDEEKNEGFVLLFDGKSLDGWSGDPNIWSVVDGAIVGRTEAEGPRRLQYNTFLTYQKKEFGNFILRFDIKVSEAGNSGMQYRSWMMPGDQPYRVAGYQADIDGRHIHTGILFGEGGFGGILSGQGEITFIDNERRPHIVRRFAESDALRQKLKFEDWNAYEVIADGFTFINIINGHMMSVCIDNDEARRKATGLLSIQAHRGPPMWVEIRNIRIRELP